jgi:hypothetical protein
MQAFVMTAMKLIVDSTWYQLPISSACCHAIRRDPATHRHTESHTESHTDTERERHTETETETETETHTACARDRQTSADRDGVAAHVDQVREKGQQAGQREGRREERKVAKLYGERRIVAEERLGWRHALLELERICDLEALLFVILHSSNFL